MTRLGFYWGRVLLGYWARTPGRTASALAALATRRADLEGAALRIILCSALSPTEWGFAASAPNSRVLQHMAYSYETANEKI